MQIICEAYQVMRDLLGMSPGEMRDVFAEWNKGDLDSYLIEITRDILGFKDAETGKPMVDKILDTAGQKGTGKWTVHIGARAGRPPDPNRRSRLRALPLGPEGRARRPPARSSQGPPDRSPAADATRQATFIDGLSRRALRQQDRLLRPGLPPPARGGRPSTGWKLNYGGIALMWRGGCIIRSRLPRQDQGGLRRRARPEEPPARRPTSRDEIDRPRRAGARSSPRPRAPGSPCPRISAALSLLRRL